MIKHPINSIVYIMFPCGVICFMFGCGMRPALTQIDIAYYKIYPKLSSRRPKQLLKYLHSQEIAESSASVQVFAYQKIDIDKYSGRLAENLLRWEKAIKSNPAQYDEDTKGAYREMVWCTFKALKKARVKIQYVAKSLIDFCDRNPIYSDRFVTTVLIADHRATSNKFMHSSFAQHLVDINDLKLLDFLDKCLKTGGDILIKDIVRFQNAERYKDL